MQTKCKKCQKEFKTYPCRIKTGKHQFCSMECRKSNLDKICVVCNKHYQIPKWKEKIQKTCSRECGVKLAFQDSRAKRMRVCLTCGEVFVKSSASSGKYCSRQCYWNSKKRKDEYLCEECGTKISPVKTVKFCKDCSRKRRCGSNHPRWIIDRTKLKKDDRRGDSAYREWRRLIWLRDNFTCKIGNQDCVGKIEAHHILSWKDHPELRYEVNNGITLCHFHHPRKRNDEMNLVPMFRELINEKTL
jgi:hypothetical protein